MNTFVSLLHLYIDILISVTQLHQIPAAVLGVVGILLLLFASHSAWVASEFYSSPSIVLSARQSNGTRVIFDDFRQSYSWLQQHTPEASLCAVSLTEPTACVQSLCCVVDRTNRLCVDNATSRLMGCTN